MRSASRRLRGWRAVRHGSSRPGRWTSSDVAAAPPMSTSRPRPEAAARARASRGRQARSPPGSRHRLPRRRGRRAVIGSPWLGASARRTLRGTTASKTRSPKWRRTSAATSAASRVRPSTIVRSIPASASFGFSRVAHELDRVQELRQALERVVLALHRHEHAVGRREGVHGQRPQGGRAVDEDEVVALPRRRERGRQKGLPVVASRQLDRGARELRPRGHEVEIGDAGLVRQLLAAARRRAGRTWTFRSPARPARTWRSPAGRGRRRAWPRPPRRGRQRRSQPSSSCRRRPSGSRQRRPSPRRRC